MIANLIDNGIRHNEPGGFLNVRTSVEGEETELVVANGGPVIDPDEAATLVEPFRRRNRSTGGFGLGLSIVRSVAEAHGGRIDLTAPEAGGLEIHVRLPAVTHSGSEPAPPVLTKS
jgi:signal transduction histidine kinase